MRIKSVFDGLVYGAPVALFLWLLIVYFFLSGCSVAHYTRHADGSVEASGYALGNDTALDGFTYETDSKGVVQLQMNGLANNQSNGMKQINKFVEAIVAGAVAGAKP
jgi:hypothetical protein